MYACSSPAWLHDTTEERVVGGIACDGTHGCGVYALGVDLEASLALRLHHYDVAINESVGAETQFGLTRSNMCVHSFCKWM